MLVQSLDYQQTWGSGFKTAYIYTLEQENTIHCYRSYDIAQKLMNLGLQRVQFSHSHMREWCTTKQKNGHGRRREMGTRCYVASTHLHNTIFLFSFIYDSGKSPPIHFRLRSSIINTHIHKYTHTHKCYQRVLNTAQGTNTVQTSYLYVLLQPRGLVTMWHINNSHINSTNHINLIKLIWSLLTSNHLNPVFCI